MNEKITEQPQHSSSISEHEHFNSALGLRLKRVRQEVAQESLAKFAKRLGIGLSTLQRWEDGSRGPDAEFLVSFAQRFQLRLEWLAYGTGPMRLEIGPPASETADKDLFPSSMDEDGNGISGLGERLRTVRDVVAKANRDEMATQMGVGKATLQAWENGERAPDVRAISKIARRYSISLDWLLYGDGQMRNVSAMEQQLAEKSSPVPEALSNTKAILGRLRQIRNALSLSPGEICLHAGVSEQTWEAWEAGTQFPHLKNLSNLARRHKIPLEWIHFGKGAFTFDGKDGRRVEGYEPTNRPVDFQVEQTKRLLENDTGPWVGRGSGPLSSQDLMRLAMQAVGERFDELGWRRAPEREAMMASLLVRKFEIEGYSKAAADDLLKLIA